MNHDSEAEQIAKFPCPAQNCNGILLRGGHDICDTCKEEFYSDTLVKKFVEAKNNGYQQGVEAMRPYARHDANCTTAIMSQRLGVVVTGVCTCGLAATLTEAGG